jgi:glycosyltransferase involved in cell wall biosynthesis
MKIAIADNNGGKFTTDIKEHWEQKGHEVRFESGASEFLAQWADVYYVDTWDNNIHYLYKLYHGLQEISPDCAWDNAKKPRIIVRALDWEVWIGLVRDQKIIDWVDNVIVIAPHIDVELRKHAEFGSKIRLIRPGVNLDKFTLKEKITDGFQLGMVLGDMWWPKNHMGGLDIFTSLYQKDIRWRLHLRGQHEGGGGGEYWRKMYEHYLQSRGIEHAVTLYPRVDDMNQWYENIDILLHPGMKEAFCYAVGEAQAKGIPAIINNFYGSKDIWEKTYLTHAEAVEALSEFPKFIEANSRLREITREYIDKNYNVKLMLSEYDNILEDF